MNTETQYIQGFNNGYILAQHESQLLSILSQNLMSNNNYLGGLIAGSEQFQFDVSKEQLYEIEKLRNRSKINGKEFGRE